VGAKYCEDRILSIGHAYGGAAQYYAMWMVSSELNPEL